MYKEKIKKWVGFVSILAICMIVATSSDVYAAKKPTTLTCSASKATEFYGVSYKNTKDKAGNLNSITVKVKKGSFNIKLVSGETTSKSDYKTIAADTSVPYANTVPITSSSPYEIPKSQLANYIGSDGDIDVVVIVVFNDFVSGETYPNDVICIGNENFVKSYTYSSNGSYSKSPTTSKVNRSNNAACQWLKSSTVAKNLNAHPKLKNIVESALSPCLEGSTTVYNMSDAGLNNIKKRIEKFYNSYLDYYEKYKDKINVDANKDNTAFSTLQNPGNGQEWIQVDGKKNKSGKVTININKSSQSNYSKLGSKKDDMLTCNSKAETTTQYMYYINKEEHNIAYTIGDGSASTKKINETVCTTTCREALTVTYGPPIAIIAGQCFTYEVEVKSNIECYSNVNFKIIPNFDDYIPCEIRGSCTNSSGSEISGYNEQAGPTEDFDNCIKKCDGGKYSQSCINSCYTEVYGNNDKVVTDSTTKTNNDNLDINKITTQIYASDTLNNIASKVSKTYKPGKTDTLVYTWSSGCPNFGDYSAAGINNIFEWVNKNITGNYSNSLKYTSANGSCQASKYGYAYFRTKDQTARIVCNYNGLNWTNGSTSCQEVNYDTYTACTRSAGCFRGSTMNCDNATDKNGVFHKELCTFSRKYDSDTGGFQRASSCSEDCSWKSTGKTPDGKVCYFVDREKAESAYFKHLSLSLDAIEGCMLETSELCKVTETKATFTMSANTDTNASSQSCDVNNYASNNSNCISKDWQDINQIKQNTTGKIDEFINNSIIKYNSSSCTNSKNETNHYHSILTFPGAWINNKNGEVVYKKPTSGSEKWYTNYNGNYCTPLTAKNVNADWFMWYQYHKTGCITETFDKWSTNSGKNIVYNIFNKIETFGKYNWNINTACYYAINSTSVKKKVETEECPTEIVENKPKCTSSKCPPNVTPDDPSTTTTVDNYASKSITGSNLFPATGTSVGKTDKVTASKLSYTDKNVKVEKIANDKASISRTEGFNWSVEATNLSVEGYPVTPSALADKVANGSTYIDSEVDYSIKLTKNQISKIKSDSKSSNFSYTSFDDGTYTTVENNDSVNKKYRDAGYDTSEYPSYTYYKSNYVSSKTTVLKKPSGKGLSCNNLKSSTECDLNLSGYVNSDQELATWLKKIQ